MLFRTRVLRTLACLYALVGSTARQVQAAEPQADPRLAVAQAHFERGVRLANVEHQWEKALEEFLLSRSLFSTRSATRNAALTLRELGRYADALELYDALFEEFSSVMPAEQLAAVQAEAGNLQKRVGWLELLDSEPGTAVIVDGKARGVTPLTRSIWLEVGVHVLRLAKEGSETSEQPIRALAGAATPVGIRLKPLEGTGVLVVREHGDEDLEVVVDSIAVGRAPFRGPVAIGAHAVQLRGRRRGTAPVAALVKLRKTTELTLSAIPLDTEALVVPKPETATVFVDGVYVGSGVWRGELPSGRHRLEALAPGYAPFQRDLLFSPGRTVLEARLVANSPSLPPALTGLFAEGVVGPMLARSLGGVSSADCACNSYSRPLGWQASLRAGYAFGPPLAVELVGGYLSTSQSATRSMTALADRGVPFRADDYADAVRLSGPFGGIGSSVRTGRRLLISSSLSAGLARLTLRTSNSGTFSGNIQVAGSPTEVSAPLSALEPTRALWAPFVSSELRVGYKLARRLSADVGVALTVFAAPSTVRTDRKMAFPQSNPNWRIVGALVLPSEAAVKTFIAATPSVGLRIEL